MEFSEDLLAELKIKISLLMDLANSLRGENEQLILDIEKKNEKIHIMKSEISKLRKELYDVKLAKSFHLLDGDSDGEAKAKLHKLVREIDKCISLLKK